MPNLSIPQHLRSDMNDPIFLRNQRGKMMERLRILTESPDIFEIYRDAIEWAIRQIEDLQNDNLILAGELDDALEDLRVMREGEDR